MRRLQVLKRILIGAIAFILAWLLALGINLLQHRQQPVDAVLVLGGSITREIYVAETVAQKTSVPILISRGSQPPCIRLIYERVDAPLDTTWLEDCAQSTFDNYRYSLPILQSWQAQHVQVLTSASHLPRAAWLARILLSSHGIWVEMVTVPERGMPGNVETPIKTGLDVGRSLIWAIVSQVYQPKCSEVMPLTAVDLATWQVRGFHCEHQGGLKTP